MAYYDDEGSGGMATETMPDKPMEEAADGETMDDTDSQVEVVSRGFFMGKPPKPGYQCKIEVVSVDGDSVLIKKLPHDSIKDDDEAMEEESEMPAKSKGYYD